MPILKILKTRDHEQVGDKLAAPGRELAQWKELSVSADYQSLSIHLLISSFVWPVFLWSRPYSSSSFPSS
jgi:hypothetical protein